jgi:hypothetical protein
LACKAKNRPPRSTASDVSSAASEIVPVGILNHVKDTGDGVDESPHDPIKAKGGVEVPENKDENVVVGKGKMPLPGINMEDEEDEDPVTVEFDFEPATMVELESLELIVPAWLELKVFAPVTKLKLIEPVWLEVPGPFVELEVVEPV